LEKGGRAQEAQNPAKRGAKIKDVRRDQLGEE